MISSYDKHNIPLLRDGCADREGDVMLLLLLVLLSVRGRSKTGQSLELSDEVNGIVVAAHINGYIFDLVVALKKHFLCILDPEHGKIGLECCSEKLAVQMLKPRLADVAGACADSRFQL